MYKRVFITHHKTGHHLCSNIAKSYSTQAGLNYYDLSTASDIPHDADIIVYESSAIVDQTAGYKFETWGGDLKLHRIDFRGVHIIRHPFEIISSGYRWHKKIDRPWLNREWEGSGKSYKEHLNTGDGVAFEMKNLSRGVIMNMYEFPFSDQRILTLKLEQFEENYVASIVQIAQHLELSEDMLLRTSAPFNLNTVAQFPRYVTRKQLGTKSYKSLFKPHHYELFLELFPSDVLDRLGYDE